MGRLLAFLGDHATWLLFGGVFIGLVLPDLAALLRPLLAPSVVLLLLSALLRADWPAMAGYARRPVLVAVLILWLMLASPILTWLLVGASGAPAALVTALVLMAAAPPILAATGLAILLGLDGALAAVAGVLSTLLTPLTLPPLALALLDVELNVGVAEFMLRLGAVIGAAFAGAALIRRWVRPAWLDARARQLNGTFVLVMLVFAVGIMDGVTETAMARPGTVALWLAAAFVANPALQAVGGLAFAWLGRRSALTVGLLSGNCNMGVLLAALPPGTQFDVVLFFALAQVPMFMLPAALSPAYRRLLGTAGPN